MIRKRVLPYSVVLIVLAGLFSGCSRGPSEEELKKAELGSQLTVIQASYQELLQERVDLKAAEEQLAEIEAIKENKRTDEQKALFEELGPKIEELATTKDAAFDVVQGQVADFLNIGLNEFPDSAETAECLKIYASEAVVVADDMVVQAGDYKKAIDHLRGASAYFEAVGLPLDATLAAKMAELDEWRFITQERFDEVKKNMTKDEVVSQAGVPYYGNIQEDSKRGVETWLFRKRDGGAAAIYFKMKNNKVYDKKFDAIKTKVAED